MFILIVLLIAGSALVYISKFNFAMVSINLGFAIFSDVPLFYIIVGSVLFGLVLSSLVYLINNISTSFKLHGKDKDIRKNKDEVLELTKRVHQLELEKEKMKNGSELEEPSDPKSL